jgi:hypothetical protein
LRVGGGSGRGVRIGRSLGFDGLDRAGEGTPIKFRG